MASVSLTTAAVDDKRWDEFCEGSPSAWFFHTTSWRDYTLAYRPDLQSRSLSFGVFEDGELVAAVPLMLEVHAEGEGDARAFSFGGGPCWAPALASGFAPPDAAAVLRAALEHVEKLAVEHDVDRSSFAVSPLLPDLPIAALRWIAAAIRAGYLDASRVSQVVDLRDDPDKLLRQMSKGHRAAIGRARKSMSVVVCTDSDDTAFEAYQSMHERAAGRVTRPQQTFDLMRAWLGRGHAVLFAARRDDRLVGFSFVIRHGQGAYYMSAANDPDEVGEPVGHLLQWDAMTWLRDHGVVSYELGAQPFGAVPHDQASDKELNIARFKRGFGGVPVPLLIGERYRSAAALSDVERRLTAFAVRLRADR
jgi:CelD/BcsL family acetyltransferase involved in cellulose biosynthesis